MREEVGGEAAHGPAPLLQAWVRVRPVWASREGEEGERARTHTQGREGPREVLGTQPQAWNLLRTGI